MREREDGRRERESKRHTDRRIKTERERKRKRTAKRERERDFSCAKVRYKIGRFCRKRLANMYYESIKKPAWSNTAMICRVLLVL